ncbi:hypothetical protein [Streptoalloteichus hindustanus]|uniref:Transglycosylase SLT domain-containing protein n=1 Tax=Streptoalloteichus hindustanus TaxID=2017 RepID=A0A1M5I542_STRHI|nr:hypothetical protein [Streptoalloteichus hindustanus]SHG23428.1 hypothetical protein SAMN05444320_107111 [Streptoalloteichus hindustanus]
MTTKEAAIIGGGILPEVAGIAVAEAKRAQLSLAVGCVMLMKESGGGRNVYGHDKVRCGPVGGSVTEENYRDYLRNRSRCGAQGVGPAQLTYPGIQDRADQLGGCWRPDINIRVGFEILADYVRTSGVRDAFSRYNTGKPGDTPYARDAMSKLPHWERIVAQADETREDMAEVPQWQWDRVFNRVLRMSAGVEGENHNGEQFNHEQNRINDIVARLEKIEAKLAGKPTS